MMPLQRLPPVASGVRTHHMGEQADIRLPSGHGRTPAKRRTANLNTKYHPMTCPGQLPPSNDAQGE